MGLQGWLHWVVILLVAGDHEVDGATGLAALGRLVRQVLQLPAHR